jgi:hypothetical protein
MLVALVVVGVAALAACGPSPSADRTAPPVQPAIQIDPSWQAADGEWTFTGRVDPADDPTDVVLEIGPGPITARRFDQQIPVADDLVEPGPLTITTRDIPDIDEICVRFSAKNGAGTSFSTPLCVPHDLPSFIVDVAPPATEFSAPGGGTESVLSATSYTVTWTETDEGTGITRRSLQRQVADGGGGTCSEFADDGPADTSASPVTASDLADGMCYRWIQTLADGAGNVTEVTSGIVRVDLSP